MVGVRDGRFGSKVGQFGSKRDNSSEPNVLKSDLKKSRICPIWGQSDPLWSQTYHPCNNITFFALLHSYVRIHLKFVQIGTKWDKSGTFKISFQFILACLS